MRATLRQQANMPQRRRPPVLIESPRRAVAPYAGRHAGMGALGITANTSAVGAGASIGTAILPGIGTAIGAVLGLVAGSLLNKQYLNVAQANSGEDSSVAAFNQYRAIAGQVAGRQFGVDAMNAVWNGAIYSGLFPLNNQRKCFHEGCLKYPGNPDWVWGTFHDGANNRFTFAYAFQQWRAARQSQPLAPPQPYAPSPYFAAGVTSTTNLPPPLTGGQSASVAPIMGVSAPSEPTALTALMAAGVGNPPNPSAMYPRAAVLSMRGLGALGTSWTLPIGGSLPDAVTFIDQFFIPNSQSDSPPWAVPNTPLEHQILYDAADAWLANQPVNTTPYVAAQYIGTSVQTPPTVIEAGSPSPGGFGIPPGYGVSAPPGSGGNFLAPVSTPQLPATPIGIAAGGGAVTSVTAATSANLDAALAAQGFTRVGTSPQGFPLYSQAGQIYAYQNGNLFPAGSVSQLAMTGGAGNGIATPTTGVDPSILATITAAIQAGMSQAQAANAGAQQLAAQGVPITPDVQQQLQTAAASPVIAPGPSSNTILLGIAAVVGLFLVTGRRAA